MIDIASGGTIPYGKDILTLNLTQIIPIKCAAYTTMAPIEAHCEHSLQGSKCPVLNMHDFASCY